MQYQLVLSESSEEKTKDVGENIFLANLPSDYSVYVFYYPGAMPNEYLEKKLRELGDSSEKNLFINIGRLNDPNYKKIVSKFEIKNLPVIIMTAVDKLACPADQLLSTYIKIDNKKLLDSPDETIECLQRLFNLFISGQIYEAIREFKKEQISNFLSRLKNIVSDALKGVLAFFKERDISISMIEGKFEIKKSGG